MTVPKNRKRSPRKPTPKRPPRTKRISRRSRWLSGGAVAVLAVSSILYLAYLDMRVRGEFEGKRWQVPARVYARPLELYPGLKLGRPTLLSELKALGYQPVDDPERPGSYSVSWDHMVVFTRDFLFWDGQEPARRLRIRFTEGRLSELEDETGREVALARLEPQQIGSLYPRHHEDRILVRLDEVPPALVYALTAVEDTDFFYHWGLDPVAIARAMWANLKAGAIVQGGSTLTQQLAKNFFLTPERSLWRKLNEAGMALLLELHYSKEEILEAYLNEVYLGQDGQRAIHGFGLASHFYFGRPLKELRLAEVAQLVALVRGPSLYDPRRAPKRAIGRRNLVLEQMARRHVISPETAEAEMASPQTVLPQPPGSLTAHPAFLELARRQLRREYREQDLTSAGLRIFTTLDPQAQSAAEQALEELVPRLERSEDAALQGAVVVADPQNGEIQALVGGSDVEYAGFNRALDAIRPIGSLIKPVVYLTALEQPQRFSLATLVSDAPLEVSLGADRVWTPANYDRESHGEVPLYQALVNSYNIATVRLGMELGLDSVVNTLWRLGIERRLPVYPSLLLGAVGLTPFEVAQVYQTLAADGFRSSLRSIREITTAEGERLRRYPLSVEQAVDHRHAYLLLRALQLVVREGTARSMSPDLVEALHPAGKTGTTDDLRDSWFAGFTGNRLAVVWLGRDDNQPIGLSGSSGALRVWQAVMREVAQMPLEPATPEGVEWALVERESGRVIEGECKRGVRLPFIVGSEPADRTSCWAFSSRAGDWP